MRTRLATPVGLLLLAFSAPVAGRADTVFLANGRSFEGVVAEETASQVKIRMPGGELSLPKSQVARVEKADSSYALYLERKQALRRDASAADWLALARWAREHGLSHGAREAALKAAQTDPRLAGLESILRGFGYVYDEELDRWIPYADSMRRRGFVEVDGQWLGRQELAERRRAGEEEAQRRAVREAAQAAASAATASRALAEMTLYREALRDTAPQPQYPPDYLDYYYPGTVAVWPGGFFPQAPPHRPPHHPGHHGPGNHGQGRPNHGYGQFVHRQPGSLFPLDSPISSRSVYSNPSPPSPRR
jgi:hypothetical protein